MKKSSRQIALAPLDDIFSVGAPADDSSERVMKVSLAEIRDFKNHPFRVQMDDEMEELVESVKTYGVLMPGIARPRQGGGYEMVAGHRRKYACMKAEMELIPLLIREMDDDTATVLMVHSNKQRENVLPSERAKALKMLLDALNRQGQRSDITSYQLGKKSAAEWSINEAVDKSGMKQAQIYRFISLTKLIPTMLQMVDNKKLAFTVAVELSSLKLPEQELLYEFITEKSIKLSLAQATKLKEMSHTNELSEATLRLFFDTKPVKQNIKSLPFSRVKRFFPGDYTVDQMEQVICKLVEEWALANHPT